ncbi:PqqD family protein [Rothia sp. P13129]|uniref:PqqD family protein n=1 Tax=unclassified Rothia (in: high G+C Gram-positive bacteria) TaxID=2689056 RepID=UPI003AD6A950
MSTPQYTHSSSCAFVLNHEVETHQEFYAVYLADLRTSEIMILEGSSAAIWVLLEAPMTLEELINEISEIYQVPVEDIKDEVTDFIQSFVSKGYLKENS